MKTADRSRVVKDALWVLALAGALCCGLAATTALANNPAPQQFELAPNERPVSGAEVPAPAAPIWGVSPISEPYPYVSSGGLSGPAVPASPDPLVRYRWPHPKASDGLEIYLRQPESATCDPASSFANVSSLLKPTPDVTVNGRGTIRVDFGRENAGWFELDSPDCPGGIQMSISEYNEPEYTNIGDKTITPEKDGHTYRAKFNREYYEGVRFGFIHVNSFTRPWHITGIRLVCQVKPANYEGRFDCSDPLLTKIWYTSAYSVKLCNLKDFTTPILIERSDRFLWNGLDFYIYNRSVRVRIDTIKPPNATLSGMFFSP